MATFLAKEIFSLLADAGDTYADSKIGDVESCFIEAANQDKAFAWMTPENQVVGFLTWAILKPDQIQEFLSGNLIPDFKNDEGEVWIMDFVAPYGGVTKMAKQVKDRMAARYGEGTVVQWKRTKRKPAKLGYLIARKGAPDELLI